MMWVYRALLIVLLLALPLAGQAAFRCGTGLVDIGDWPVEVAERCGEPDYIAVYPRATLPGIGVIQTVEHWYYNPGPSGFIRRLVFRDGRLRREESMGYGFLPGAAGDCSPRSLQMGLSEFEVIERCGDPLSKRVNWVVPRDQRSRHGSLQTVFPVEEWLYEFGRNEFRRVITIQDGRVTDVDTAGKPAH